MIYGAMGHTGRVACQHAGSVGLDFVIHGRTESKLRKHATSLTVLYQVFPLNEACKDLKSVSILLNRAGPFAVLPST